VEVNLRAHREVPLHEHAYPEHNMEFVVYCALVLGDEPQATEGQDEGDAAEVSHGSQGSEPAAPGEAPRAYSGITAPPGSAAPSRPPALPSSPMPVLATRCTPVVRAPRSRAPAALLALLAACTSGGRAPHPADPRLAPVDDCAAFRAPALEQRLDAATGSVAREGNAVTLLVDGEAAFARRFENAPGAQPVPVKAFHFPQDEMGSSC